MSMINCLMKAIQIIFIFIASKKLPFPTNKELPMLPVNQESKIPYDVLRNDLTVIDPEDSQFGEMTITTPQGNGLILIQNPNGTVGITATNWENTSELEKYILIRRAKEALSEFDGQIMFTNFDIPLNIRQAIGLSGDGYLTGEIDVALDFEAFNLTLKVLSSLLIANHPIFQDSKYAFMNWFRRIRFSFGCQNTNLNNCYVLFRSGIEMKFKGIFLR